MAPTSHRMAAAAATLLCLLSAAAAVKPLSDFSSGSLTFYGGAPDGMDPSSQSFGTKDGSCGYGPADAGDVLSFSNAALSPENEFFKNSPLNGCGMCFQLQCDDSRGGVCKTDSAGKPLAVIVRITDSCPECESDHIDAQALAFEKIAKPEIGRIKIQFRRVECVTPSDLQVNMMDFNGGGGWLRLAVADTGGRGAVKSVAVKGSGSSEWRDMENTWGAAWELSSAPTAPLDFRFTLDNDEEVLAEDVVKQNGGISGGVLSPVIFNTGVQFSIDDPVLQTVHAFDGADDPTIVTSTTPGNDLPADLASADSPAPGPSESSPSPSPSSSPSPSPSESSPNPSLSSSPSSSPSPSSPSPSGSSSGCSDEAPPGSSYTCQQQKDYGQCGADFMKGYCQSTCGGCSSTGRRRMARRLAMTQ